MSNISTTIPYHRFTVVALCALFGGLVMYIYFLNVSVVEVVLRKDLMGERNKLRTEIAVLEAGYIEAQHSISARIANLDGYTPDAAKIFLARTPDEALAVRDQ